MKLHKDASTIEEIAYNCFWFEESTLKEELSERGIDSDSNTLIEMLNSVGPKADMWIMFTNTLIEMIERGEGE